MINLRTYTSESCTHVHEYYQLVFPLKGQLELQVGHQLGIVNSNQAAFIMPQEKHCFASNDQNLFIVIDTKIENNWMNNSKIPSFWDLPPTVKEFLPYAKNYLTKKNLDLTSHTILADFFDKLLMQHFLSNDDPAVFKARNWIDLHFADPLNLKIIAKNCHLSCSQLQRRFKRIMGQSMGEYWRSKRLQQAQLLLKNTGISIETVALSVGYENVAAFSRSFSRQFQISPSEFRNMHFSAKNLHLEDNT